jgi:hypothetical protein
MNCQECEQEAEVEITVRRFVFFDDHDPVDEYGFCAEYWTGSYDGVQDLKERIKQGDFLELEGVRDSMDVLREHVSERPAMYLGNFDDLQTGYDLTDKQVDELRRLSMQLLDDGSE